MNVALWITQALLAAVFAGSGALKATMARQRLIDTGQTGVAMFPMPLVRFVAVMEMFAALGLILPRLLQVDEFLTPAAAGGLCVVMIGAAWAHTRLREPRTVAANAALFALALFIVIGRTGG